MKHTLSNLNYVLGVSYFLLFSLCDAATLLDIAVELPLKECMQIASSFLFLGGLIQIAATNSCWEGYPRSFWRPFEGTTQFILLQAFGWTMFCISFLGGLCLHSEGVMIGIYTVIGILGLFGLFLLKNAINVFPVSMCNLSVQASQAAFPSRKISKVFEMTSDESKKFFTGDIVFSILFSFVSLFLFLVADFLRSRAFNISIVNTVVICGQVGFILAAFSSHFMSGLSRSHFKALLSLQVLLVVYFVGTELPELHLPIILSQIGVIGFISQFLLMLSLKFYDEQVARSKSESSEKLSNVISFDNLLDGEVSLGIILACCSTVGFIIIDVCRVYQMELDFVGGLLYVGMASAFASALATPISHIGGLRLHPEFNIWMPFGGTSKFVLLQSLGWAFYAISTLLVWIYLANYALNPQMVGISFVSIGSLISTVLIIASLHYFEPFVKQVDKSDKFSALMGRLLSGEMVLAWMFCLLSFICYISVDLASHGISFLESNFEHSSLISKFFSVLPSIRIQIFAVGILLQILAPVLLQCVAGPRLYPDTFYAYNPLAGGQAHIVLQHIGWILNSLTVFFHIILYINTLESAHRGVLSFSALLSLLANFLLYISILVFESNSSNMDLKVSVEFGIISKTEDVEKLSGCSTGLVKLCEFAEKESLPDSVKQLLNQISKQVSDKVNVNEDVSSLGISSRWKLEVLVSKILSIANLFLWLLIDICRYYHNSSENRGLSNSFVFQFFIKLSEFFPLRGLAGVSEGLVKFSFSAQWIILFLVHVVAGTRLHDNYRLYQPFVGGWKFALFQAIGFVIFGISLILSWLILHYGVGKISINGLLTLFGFVQSIGNFSLIYSLKEFKSSKKDSQPRTISRLKSVLYLSKVNTSQGDLIISVVLSICAVGMFLLVDFLKKNHPEIPTTPILIGGSVAMLIGLALAYWSSKKGKHEIIRTNEDDEGINDISIEFSWMQMLALTFSVLTLVLVILTVQFNIKKIQPVTRVLNYYNLTGIGGITAELILVVIALSGQSVLQRERSYSILSSSFLREFFLDVRTMFVVIWIYSGHLIVFGGLVLRIVVYQTPSTYAVLIYFCLRILLPRILMIICNVAYALLLLHGVWSSDYEFIFWIAATLIYGATYYTNAEMTGSRRWNFYRNCFIWNDAARYFNFKVVGTDKLSSNKTYFFGYAPHAILPFSIGWGFLADAWKKKYPGVETDIFGASILMNIPIIRDTGMWSGGRDVRKECISHCLSHNRSVALVPGGQAEMRECRPESKLNHEIVIVSKHQGFVRLAIQHGVDLVPIYSFGETEILENIYLPSLQQLFLKTVGFLFPTWIYGRWYMNIPHPKSITFAVADPISVSKMEDPPKEEVDRVHKLFYDRLQETFEKHKVEAGYGHCRLTMKSK